MALSNFNRSGVEIMSDHPHWGGSIRKLWSTESGKLRDHLMRLDKDSRRLRFGHTVSDQFVQDYAARVPAMGCIIHAYMENGLVRAVAELRRLGSTWGYEAEAAFSVETPWQNRGIGSELMGRVICSARNRGVERLMMGCLAENTKILAIARKQQAQLSFERGEVYGEIHPCDASYQSLLEEAVADRFGFAMAVLDIGSSGEHEAA